MTQGVEMLPVDWSKPIEAVHSNGQIIPVNVREADKDGSYYIGGPDNDWPLWADGDGTVWCTGWRIRNVVAHTHPAATGSVREADGQDRKFAFRDGQFVNRVSGEPIPHDEPIIIFRARDHHAIPVLREYLSMATDDHHQQAIRERLAEFAAYRDQHPERMKEPGITHHIALAAAPTPDAAASEAGEVERMSLLLDQWDAAYRAFTGAFDTALSRRKQDDDYSRDARRRLRKFDEAYRAALTTQGGAEG